MSNAERSTPTAGPTTAQERIRKSWDTYCTTAGSPRTVGNGMITVGMQAIAGTQATCSMDANNSRYTIATAGMTETLETLAAEGMSTAVGTGAKAESLATARIQGTSTALRTSTKAGSTAATRDVVTGTSGDASTAAGHQNLWNHKLKGRQQEHERQDSGHHNSSWSTNSSENMVNSRGNRSIKGTATSARRLQDIVLRTPTTAGSQATLPIKKPQF
jgi:hypothetical protein